MGRRAVKGKYGRAVPQSEHLVPDDQLMNGGQYGRHRGVKRQRVLTSFQQGLINRYMDSKGAPTYHAPTCDQQWQEMAEPSTVSVATTGQRAKGMTGPDAMEVAGDFSPNPVEPGATQPAKPVTEKEKKGKKVDLLYGQARTKGMIHKAQMDEVKFHNLTGGLVDKAGVVQMVQEMASMTRTRVLEVSDSVIDDLFGIYEEEELDYDTRKVKARLKLRADLERALTTIADFQKVLDS